MISLHAVSHAYGDTTVLDEIGLSIPRGKLTALVGPNGAGKSTLLSAMARLLSPDAGSIMVGDLDVSKTKPAVMAKQLAVLKQLNQLSARLTVIDLVRFGRFPHSQGRLTPECHAIVEQSLDYVDLQGFRDRYLDQLSGGQRQRALIAMVLAQDTEYILLDEPLNNLDMRHAVSMMQLLRQAADDLGRTIVVVLHDINFASTWTDHLVGMRDGAVVAQGSPDEIVSPGPLRDIFGINMQVVEVHGAKIGMYWHPDLLGADERILAGSAQA